MKYIYLLTFILLTMPTYSQSDLPYHEVPDYPESYSAGTVAARMIDGLGFRYYWATDSLKDADLSYKPSTDARTCMETLQHIYGMSIMILNATKSAVNEEDSTGLNFNEIRKRTLLNLKEASNILKKSDDLEKMTIKYEGHNGLREYPFWHHLNGPIADCLWHVGQVVSFRRSSGNPIYNKVSFFSGRLRE